MFKSFWAGMLAGGEGKPPRPEASGRRPPDLDVRRLPIEMGTTEALSWISPIAATAATTAAVGVLFDTLLRRATRLLVVRGPDIVVCELFRECDCRAVDIPERDEEREGRCVKGREVCSMSCERCAEGSASEPGRGAMELASNLAKIYLRGGHCRYYAEHESWESRIK